jgi:hypothetical protein
MNNNTKAKAKRLTKKDRRAMAAQPRKSTRPKVAGKKSHFGIAKPI